MARLHLALWNVVESNPCHLPAGRPDGGQFCSTEDALNIRWESPTEAVVTLSPTTHYRIHFRSELAGFLEYGQSIKDATVTREEVDLAVEHQAIKTTFEAAEAFWTSNDVDARAIRRSDRDDPEAQKPGRQIGAMIVMTLSIRDYGVGSGDVGSAKVFWGPYSAPRRRERLKTDADRSSQWDESYGDSFGVDPVHVLAHELHHAWGSTSEFDIGSEIVALDAHLKLGLRESAVRRAVHNALYTLVATYRYGQGSRKIVAGRGIRYLHKRNPDALREIALRDYESGGLELDRESYNRLIESVLMIGRRRTRTNVSEAGESPLQVSGRSWLAWPVRCLNAFKKKARSRR